MVADVEEENIFVKSEYLFDIVWLSVVVLMLPFDFLTPSVDVWKSSFDNLAGSFGTVISSFVIFTTFTVTSFFVVSNCSPVGFGVSLVDTSWTKLELISDNTEVDVTLEEFCAKTLEEVTSWNADRTQESPNCLKGELHWQRPKMLGIKKSQWLSAVHNLQWALL